MFLFLFSYLGQPHCASCNESNIDNNPTFYEDLASIIIENYFKDNKLTDISDRPLKIEFVKIYKIDNITEDIDIEKHLIHKIKGLDLRMPKNFI